MVILILVKNHVYTARLFFPQSGTAHCNINMMHQTWCDGEGNGTPPQYSCLEDPMNRGAWQATVHGVAMSLTQQSDFTFTENPWDRGAWWAATYGVTQSWTRLKRLSSSSSSSREELSECFGFPMGPDCLIYSYCLPILNSPI